MCTNYFEYSATVACTTNLVFLFNAVSRCCEPNHYESVKPGTFGTATCETD